ncbi:MAG: hypothetical protein ACRD96_12655 [Bryobacteraceae bacterium]
MPRPDRVMLVNALCSMVCPSRRRQARRFLLGLAADELFYIVEFLSFCTIESTEPCAISRDELARAIERFDSTRTATFPDREHKMILLLEYVCRSSPEPAPVAVRATRG